MKSIIKTIFSLLLTILFLGACSSTPLQSTRLNKAEKHILQAEQELLSHVKNRNIAETNLGTANAYLATVNDNRKFLNKNEVERLRLLTLRANNISSHIFQ